MVQKSAITLHRVGNIQPNIVSLLSLKVAYWHYLGFYFNFIVLSFSVPEPLSTMNELIIVASLWFMFTYAIYFVALFSFGFHVLSLDSFRDNSFLLYFYSIMSNLKPKNNAESHSITVTEVQKQTSGHLAEHYVWDRKDMIAIYQIIMSSRESAWRDIFLLMTKLESRVTQWAGFAVCSG